MVLSGKIGGEIGARLSGRGRRHLVTAGSVAVALTVAAARCSAAGTGEGLDASRQGSRREGLSGVDAATAGGVVARVETPAGQRTVAAGPAGVDGGDQLSGHEAFRIGSVTKVFTATAALQPVEVDAVDLDAPVTAVLPERVRQEAAP